MPETQAVLFANEAFYGAFTNRDFEQMADVWAEKAKIVCIHPGWPPIYGRRDVMESWRQILANEDQFAIECHEPRAVINGDSAFVICYEKMPGGWLIATNGFVREGRKWRIVFHQAGPVMEPPPVEGEADEPQDAPQSGGNRRKPKNIVH